MEACSWEGSESRSEGAPGGFHRAHTRIPQTHKQSCGSWRAWPRAGGLYLADPRSRCSPRACGAPIAGSRVAQARHAEIARPRVMLWNALPGLGQRGLQPPQGITHCTKCRMQRYKMGGERMQARKQQLGPTRVGAVRRQRHPVTASCLFIAQADPAWTALISGLHPGCCIAWCLGGSRERRAFALVAGQPGCRADRHLQEFFKDQTAVTAVPHGTCWLRSQCGLPACSAELGVPMGGSPSCAACGRLLVSRAIGRHCCRAQERLPTGPARLASKTVTLVELQ